MIFCVSHILDRVYSMLNSFNSFYRYSIVWLFASIVSLSASAALRWDETTVETLWYPSLLSQGDSVGRALAAPSSVGPAGYDPNKLSANYYDAINTYAKTIAFCREQTFFSSCSSVFDGYSEDRWISYIHRAYETYILQFSSPGFNLPARWRFTDGLFLISAMEKEQSGQQYPIVDEFVMQSMRDNPSYSKLLEFTRDDAVWDTGLARPVAYALEAHINAEKFGLPRDEVRVELLVRVLLSYFEQWTAQTQPVDIQYTTRDGSKTWDLSITASRTKVFFTGLSAKALVDFYEWEEQNSRLDSLPFTRQIPEKLRAFYEFAYDSARIVASNSTGDNSLVGQRLWQDAAATQNGVTYGGFYYVDRNYIHPVNTDWSDYIKMSPDLNMMMAPVYGWLAKHYISQGSLTESEKQRAQALMDRGDDVFMSGIYGRYIAQGKQYNQHYRWSLDYPGYRKSFYDTVSDASSASDQTNEKKAPPSKITNVNVRLIPAEE